MDDINKVNGKLLQRAIIQNMPTIKANAKRTPRKSGLVDFTTGLGLGSTIFLPMRTQKSETPPDFRLTGFLVPRKGLEPSHHH